MLTRLLGVACCFVVLAACDERPKGQSRQTSICKSLNQADCTANAECRWNAEKDKCRQTKADEAQPQRSPPPSSQPAPPPRPNGDTLQ